MAEKKVETVRLASPRGVTVSVKETKVEALLGQGYKKSTASRGKAS